MANVTSVLLLEAEPLITTDAGGLEVAVSGVGIIQPSFILRRDWSDPATPQIAADDDIWRVLLSPPTAMANFEFYIIALRATFLGTESQGFAAAFWQTVAEVSIVPTDGAPYVWYPFNLDARDDVYTGTGVVNSVAATPPFAGFPPAPITADQGSVAGNALAGFQFTVGTFVEAERAAMSLHVDARWLAFPRNATRNAAFYMPRLNYRLGNDT